MPAQLLQPPSGAEALAPAAQEPPPDDSNMRWSDDMAAGDFNSSHWRKSFQWFTLVREHAQIISDDTFVLERFLVRCPAEAQ